MGNTVITANGAFETIYIYQRPEDTNVYYSTYEDRSDEMVISNYPCHIYNRNPDPATNVLKVIFQTNLTFTASSQFFMCDTNGIQFGDKSIHEDGTRTIITISEIPGYPGLIQASYDHIFIYNIFVSSDNNSSYLEDNGGWIAQQTFAPNATNVQIVNCGSDGGIPNNCGGIVGQNAFIMNTPPLNADDSRSLKIIGCFSTGEISGESAGGILGPYAGYFSDNSIGTANLLLVKGCWSTGVISGNNAGGIFGQFAGYDGTEIDRIVCTTDSCYSTGLISGSNVGGIFGANALNAVVLNCSSIGNITGVTSGGIFGINALNAVVSNSFTSGNVDTDTSGAVFGPGSSNVTVTKTYGSGNTNSQNGYFFAGITDVPVTCFSEANSSEGGITGGWKDTNASNTLLGVFPNQLCHWVSTSPNTPFEVFNVGVTPYSLNIIDDQGQVNNKFSIVIVPGGTSDPAVITSTFSLILPDLPGYDGISINTGDGSITCASSVPAGNYTLIVRYTGSYYYSTVLLTVSKGCCADSLKNVEFGTRYDVIAGDIIRQGPPRYGPMPYSDLMKLRKASTFRR